MFGKGKEKISFIKNKGEKMMRKMKKVLKRALGSMVVVALLVSNVSFVSLAAEFATAEGASTETSLVNTNPN